MADRVAQLTNAPAGRDAGMAQDGCVSLGECEGMAHELHDALYEAATRQVDGIDPMPMAEPV